MLNIITSLSPDVLADDMLRKIRACWTDPFAAPIIVFPDTKTEQWFKLHALKKQSVLMNLCTARLEYFLFDALKTADDQSLLSYAMLRDVIVQKLLSETGSGIYLNTIKANDNIANYLNITENTNHIDYGHLFDFANDLSSLFIEYEATRTCIDDAIPGDDWQKDLYNEIINAGIALNGRHYYTCPELAEKNKAEHNGKIVFKTSSQPVFVFGFSGMGQTYRNLLKEFGRQSDIYVYLQTTENSDDNENIFLKHWAQFGKKNHELFGVGTPAPEKPQYKDNTTLGKIQNAIAQNKNICDTAELKVAADKDKKPAHDDSLTITSVPSMIKEMEIVHSAICRLLKDKEKNVTLKDILVLAPDISQYASAIAAVFNQIDDTDKEYPFIPFSIVDDSGKNSAILDALQTLYAILHNGGLTRKTFFDFTNNFVVQNKYKITNQDVSNVFQPWIENMQVFRAHTTTNTTNKDQTADDWESAVNRTLIAKLTDNDKMMPFSDFNTEDNELLAKFVRICSDIKYGWLGKFKDRHLLESKGIDDLQTFLTETLAPKNGKDLQSPKEKLIFGKIIRELEQYKEFDAPVPLECVLLSLMDIASNMNFSTGALFTHGITFTSLTPNRVLSAKYVFLIGMDSANFPGTNKKIVLDRRIHSPQNGDDDIPGKNKNTFLCQLMATGDELHASFVDKDLQTDNTFYPSSVLDVLMEYTDIKTREIGIDENRPWRELYTPREWRAKRTCRMLNQSAKDTHPQKSADLPTNNASATKDLPTTVRIKEFQYFLENPLKRYAANIFGFIKDDKSSQELEDIKLNKLEQSNLKKRLAKPALAHQCSPENNAEPKWENYKDMLPNEPFGSLEFNDVLTDIKSDIRILQMYNSQAFGNRKMTIEANFPINVHLNCMGAEYDLRGEILLHEADDTDIVLNAKNLADTKKHYPEMYALIAQVAQPDKEYTVHIIYPTGKNIKAVVIPHLTKEFAENKLNEFYKQAFINGEKRHIPYFDTSIYGAPKKGQPRQLKVSFEGYKAKFMDTEYPKYYIANAELFNPDTDLGFNQDNFETEYPKAFEEHEKLLDLPE